MTPFPDPSILCHLAGLTQATAAEIGITCRMTAGEVRSRLAGLESRRLVAGRLDARLVPPA